MLTNLLNEDNSQYVLSMYSGTFFNFLNEFVDVTGYKNRMFMRSLSEAQSFSVSDKLVSALYKSAMDKYSMIDFGKIPDSKGDFDKLEKIKELEETLGILDGIFKERGDFKEVETIKNTIEIVKSYKKEFVLGFVNDVPLIIMIYNSIVYSIYCAISSCMKIAIDFLRTPNGSLENSRNIQRETDKMDTVVFDNLEKFNKASVNGDLKKLFNETLRKENFVGLGTLGTLSLSTGTIAAVGLVAASLVMIPIIRELIYFSYNRRMEISEFFKLQAEFLEINVAELKNNNGDKKVIKRQEKRIEQLVKIADKFEVEFNKAEKETRRQLRTKITTDDVRDSLSKPSEDLSSFGIL